jgi:hypothetical protein
MIVKKFSKIRGEKGVAPLLFWVILVEWEEKGVVGQRKR